MVLLSYVHATNAHSHAHTHLHTRVTRARSRAGSERLQDAGLPARTREVEQVTPPHTPAPQKGTAGTQVRRVGTKDNRLCCRSHGHCPKRRLWKPDQEGSPCLPTVPVQQTGQLSATAGPVAGGRGFDPEPTGREAGPQ